jgi:ribosome-associated heat shock protein Hsp15
MMTGEKQGERIDKFLWSVRLFKSRSIATEECKKGRVLVGTNPVKPAFLISPGATITVRKPPVTYTYTVKEIPKNRVGAALVPGFITDTTPPEEKEKLVVSKMTHGYRPRGTGRPTKRERRELDDFLE